MSSKDTSTGRGRAIAVLFWLIPVLFLADFAFGIQLGGYDDLFHPIYRLRQSLAVALSRMKDPPLGGYLAYGAVVDSMSLDGMRVYPKEPGPPFQLPRVRALFADPVATGALLNRALNAPVTPGDRYELIEGNEVGYADYIYLAFRIFGINAQALYYFTYLLLGISVLTFMIFARRSGLYLYLLATILIALIPFQEYILGWSDTFTSVQNSRTFEFLALIPALHLLILQAEGKFSRWRIAGAIVQSAILAFLIFSRNAVVWEVAVLLAFGIAAAIYDIISRKRSLGQLAGRFYASAIVVLVIVSGSFITRSVSDDLYHSRGTTHLFWHNVLAGMMQGNPLSRSYDGGAYDAVRRDLTARDDDNSQISFRKADGTISMAPEKDWAEYDRLAKRVVLQLIADDPLGVLSGVWNRLQLQHQAELQYPKPLDTLIPSGIIFAAVSLLAALAGALPRGWLGLSATFVAAILAVIASHATVVMTASIVNVGALFVPLIALAILCAVVLSNAAWFSFRLFGRTKPA